MKTSALIPCYNGSRHIKRVIEHLLVQTHPIDEIIVVDDCSTDDTVAIIKTLPVRLVQHERNQGPAVARNTAAQHSTGDILIFIDSDAYATADMNEKIIAAYENHSQDLLVGGVGGRGIEARVETVFDEWRALHGAQNFGSYIKTDVPYLFGLCCSYPRSVFEKVGGFDPFYRINAGEDLEIGLRIRQQGYHLIYDPEICVEHQHQDSHTSLLRVQYNWTYWSYISMVRRGLPAWRNTLGPYWRFIRYAFADLLIRRRPDLVKLDCEIFDEKRRAITDAREKIRTMPKP